MSTVVIVGVLLQVGLVHAATFKLPTVLRVADDGVAVWSDRDRRVLPGRAGVHGGDCRCIGAGGVGARRDF